MYRNYRRVLITLVLLYAAMAATASAQADKVDEYIKSEMQKRKIPGLSLAVVKNGEVIKAQGYGLANIELNVPATADTIYQSGSVGKQFTSAAVMLLVEEGKINLDDKYKQVPRRHAGNLERDNRAPLADAHFGDQELWRERP